MPTDLLHQAPEHDEETHQFSRIGCEYPVRVVASYILCCRSHTRCDNFASSVHQQLREPLEHLLYLLRVWLLEILHRETYSDVADTSCNLSIGLSLY